MGLVNSTYYASPQAESSYLDSDDEFSPGSQNYEVDSKPQYFDAPPVETQMIQHTYDRAITDEKIAEIEKELEFYEKVSLVYLLYDNAKLAFERLKDLQQHPDTSVLLEWSIHSMQTDNWQTKLLEALTLIQNYRVLYKLGYETSDVKEHFLPFNENTSLINRIKRSLYNVCENLTNDETDSLLLIVRHDFQNKKKIFEEFEQKYLEFYISYWMTVEYISPTNLTNLYQVLQAIPKHELANNLKLLVPNFMDSSEESRAVDYYHNEHFAVRDRIQNNTKCYVVDSKCPGICFIINQEYFFTEPEKDDSLQSRLPPGFEAEKLENRVGTKLDCNKLSATFNELGFTVIVKNDLDHLDMEKEIQDVVNMVTNHSSLVICILSHGTEGMVYGVNSIPIEVRDIQNSMCKTNPNLNDKPKILILQACRGVNYMQLTTDGGNTEYIQKDMHSGTVPQTWDMLVFCATCPGYVALRSPNEGTWFIQSLCDAISEEANQEHFGDICTSVLDRVCRKRWKTEEGIIIGMVPVLESTLRKKFYLPQLSRT